MHALAQPACLPLPGRTRGARTRAAGFTVIELVVTLALVGLLAMVAVPLYEVTAIRMKEVELRSALRQIRTALDAYKDASDAGRIAKDAGDSGYPPNLKVLVEGVDSAQSSVAMTGVSAQNAPLSATGPARIVFLRQIPRDPFAPDGAVPPEEQWGTRAYGAMPEDPQPGRDVFDVASKSAATGSNGVAYKDW